MLKVKHVVTAVAIALVATGAMASNFRAADQVYVPAAGHLAGGSGTFISDVFISNLSSDPVTVSVILSQGPNGAQTTFNNVISLAANERKEMNDFIVNTLGLSATASTFGQLIFNGCKTGGNCTLTCPGADANGNCPDFRNISVESRIFSIPPNSANPATAPTTGQLFSGIPWYNFVSSSANGVGLDKVFITGIRNTGSVGQAGTYRSNIGLVNASQFSTTTLRVKLFDGKTDTQIGADFTQTLQPLGQAQPNISVMFPSFAGSGATNAWVQVTQENTVATSDAAANNCGDGCPAFFAYGSILDNLSGDATTLEPQFFVPLTNSAIQCIYNSTCKSGLSNVIHRAVAHQ
ncbi:MAG TPA: hypothetical protein VKU62_12150 [Thermoanaerobaculia bacterium]|nr:hypothetical protein [Thermoanaerobaculia bacterium]